MPILIEKNVLISNNSSKIKHKFEFIIKLKAIKYY